MIQTLPVRLHRKITYRPGLFSTVASAPRDTVEERRFQRRVKAPHDTSGLQPQQPLCRRHRILADPPRPGKGTAFQPCLHAPQNRGLASSVRRNCYWQLLFGAVKLLMPEFARVAGPFGFVLSQKRANVLSA
jgi:hypothetical protein